MARRKSKCLIPFRMIGSATGVTRKRSEVPVGGLPKQPGCVLTAERKKMPETRNEWVKLTDAEIQKLEREAWVMQEMIRKFDTMKFARSIEELSKEKNYG